MKVITVATTTAGMEGLELEALDPAAMEPEEPPKQDQEALPSIGFQVSLQCRNESKLLVDKIACGCGALLAYMCQALKGCRKMVEGKGGQCICQWQMGWGDLHKGLASATVSYCGSDLSLYVVVASCQQQIPWFISSESFQICSVYSILV